MRLISSALSLALRKSGLFAALVAALFLVGLAKSVILPTIFDAVDERERLPEVRSEVQELRRQVSVQESELEHLHHCGLPGKIGDLLLPGAPCKATQEKVDKAEAALEASKQELAERKRLEARLERAQASWRGRVLDQWFTSWRRLLPIAALVVVMPYVLRAVSYYVLMPLVRRKHKPTHLASGVETASAELRTTAAQRTLAIELGHGEVLSARSEYVRPVQGKVRSRLLYRWNSPFISFAAGLHELTQVTGDEAGTSATLATPDDPDSYLMRIDFKEHPGVVMQPRHVVGVIGAPDLRTRWRWGIHSFATWQVRYIMFAGTGSLIVQGSGDVAATNPGGKSTRMDQNLVMGFDSRLSVGFDRTAVFWPYLWGRTPLVDDEFTGEHPLFWQKSTAEGPSSSIAKAFNALFSAVGKLLGF